MKIKYTKTEKVLMFSIISLVIYSMGIIMNYVVISNNDGMMPVLYNGVDYKTEVKSKSLVGFKSHLYYPDSENVNFEFLGDVHSIGDDFIYFSKGDLMVTIGIFLFALSQIIFYVMKRKESKFYNF